MTELYHHGILGMKWGVRRYQNKDGSLTPEGRKRLELDKYDERSEDITLKKNTKMSRVVKFDDLYDIKYDKGANDPNAIKKYVKEVLDKDKTYNTKYFSVDGIRNSGRKNGKDFYLTFYTDDGYAPDEAAVTMYTLKKDVKIASAKKVADAIVEEIGSKRITELLKGNPSEFNEEIIRNEYTKLANSERPLFDKIATKFKDMGYDGVEDVNDNVTDMPIILFDSTNVAIRDAKIQSGKDAIDKYFKKLEN